MNRKIFREQNSTLTVLDAYVLSLIMVRRLIKQWLVVVRKSHRRDLQYLRDSSRRINFTAENGPRVNRPPR